MTIEEISDSTTGNTEKCASCNTVEEATHDHGLDVLGHRTRDQPYQEETEREDIDVSPAIELTGLVMICDILGAVKNKPRTRALRTKVQSLKRNQHLTNHSISPEETRTKTPYKKGQPQSCHDLRAVELGHYLIVGHGIH